MKKVLFVDDEQNLLDGLRRMLRKKKDEWDMKFMDSGQKALDYLKENKIDIIVTDYKMPSMNGLELLQAVKEEHPGILRVILSGQSESEIFDKAQEIADNYVAKPCDPDELISLIDAT